jgi:alcohol dehydrogenase class IV
LKTQREYSGIGSIKNLKNIIYENSAKKIFLVTGKKSFELSGAKDKLNVILRDKEIIHFDKFSEVPESDEIEKGVKIFKEANCDTVIAVGGGSVIDTAKLINVFSANDENIENYIKGKTEIINRGNNFTAIPTTSGAGSEATHFAVVYQNREKFSVAHDFILPDNVILDPELTFSLPENVTAISGIDAFSQAIESYWSVNSTEESKRYSSESIKLLKDNLVSAVNSPNAESRINMMKAANLSGKAINITKTTAPHAISYSMTSYFGVPHGQAVCFTLGEFLEYNYELNENELTDIRGMKFVRNSIEEISELLGCNTVSEAGKFIKTLIKSIGLKTNLSESGIKSDDDINIIIENVNTERMQNNPRTLTKGNLEVILRNIL